MLSPNTAFYFALAIILSAVLKLLASAFLNNTFEPVNIGFTAILLFFSVGLLLYSKKKVKYQKDTAYTKQP
jgi:hypothetical protein